MRQPFLALCSFAVALLLAINAPAGELPSPDYVPAEATVISESPCVGGVCAVAPQRTVVRHAAPRRVVVHQHNHTTVINGSAQADAEAMAACGVLRHQGNNGGCREGIGYSTVSADDAIRRCCFYGRYRAREIGVARGSRGYYACIRYE